MCGIFGIFSNKPVINPNFLSNDEDIYDVKCAINFSNTLAKTNSIKDIRVDNINNNLLLEARAGSPVMTTITIVFIIIIVILVTVIMILLTIIMTMTTMIAMIILMIIFS